MLKWLTERSLWWLVNKLFARRWVDPGLSLTIAVWLGAWASRLLARRAHLGRDAWTRND